MRTQTTNPNPRVAQKLTQKEARAGVTGEAPGMLSAKRIIALAAPVQPVESGIYFLIRAGFIVYVGKSVHIAARIATHAASWREFDSWHWVPCPVADLTAMERLYINRLMPEGNLDPKTKMRRERLSPPVPPSAAGWPAVDLSKWAGCLDLEFCEEAEAERAALLERMAALRGMQPRFAVRPPPNPWRTRAVDRRGPTLSGGDDE